GDAVLGLVAADMLFRRFASYSEGELTQLRAALVRMEALAILAAEVRLGDALLIGKGEEATGGRVRMTNLGRAFEAVLGAIYIDRGLLTVENFLLPRLSRLLDHVLANMLH